MPSASKHARVAQCSAAAARAPTGRAGGQIGQSARAAVERALELLGRRPDALAAIAIILIGCVLFRTHLLGRGILLGNADRLHTFLNLRLFEVDSWRHGWLSTWNDLLMLGFTPQSLHYVHPGLDPLALPLLLVPREQTFWAAGLVMVALWMVGTWVSFQFVRQACGSALFGLLGGVLYTTAPLVILRLNQVDGNFLLLILIPSAMLVIHRAERASAIGGLLLLAALLTVLMVLTFLQEVAYAILLIGAYALYRGLAVWSWRPPLLFAIAMVAAAFVGLPRAITVLGDVQGYDRTSTLILTNPIEILRWLSDGIYGRYPSEALSIGNMINLHEGFQVYTSTFAAFVLLVGILRYRGPMTTVSAGLLVLAVAVASEPLVGATYAMLGAGAVAVVHVVAGLVAWLGGRPLLGDEPRSDVPFHLGFLALVVAGVMIEPARYLLYEAFLRLDFTHSRLSIVGLLPICVLVSVFLRELAGDWQAGLDLRGRAVAVGLAVAAGAVLVILTDLGGTLLQGLGPRTLASIPSLPAEAMRVVVAAVLVLVCLGLAWVLRFVLVEHDACRLRVGVVWPTRSTVRPWQRALPMLALAVATTLQSIANISFQLNGAQTETYPRPFLSNNLFVAPPGAMRPPTEAQIEQLGARLDSDRYRVVLLPDLDRFAVRGWPLEPAYAPHIAQLWRLRVAEGYGPGLNERVIRLPWPDGIRSLRSISYPLPEHLPWPLLAALNVKYVVGVTPDLYYGVDPAEGGSWLERLEVTENPLPATPREFFAASVRTVPSPPVPERVAPLSLAPAGLDGRAIDGGLLGLSWRDVGGGSWYEITWSTNNWSTTGPLLTTSRGETQTGLAGLPPDTEVVVSIRACDGRRCSPFSPDLRVRTATPGLRAPTNLRARALDSRTLELTWADPQTDVEYVIEQQGANDYVWRPLGRVSAGSHTFLVRDREPLTTTAFRMRACQGESCSAHSGTASAATPSSMSTDELRGILPADMIRETFVEGMRAIPDLGTDGEIHATYVEGRIDIQVTPSERTRFLVLNEMYNRSWRAWVDGAPAEIHPTNVVMRGIVVPPGATHVELVCTPFLYSLGALPFYVAGVVILIAGLLLCRLGPSPRVMARARTPA